MNTIPNEHYPEWTLSLIDTSGVAGGGGGGGGPPRAAHMGAAFLEKLKKQDKHK